MIEVFLSYRREDRAIAQRLADGLRSSGFAVAWDAELQSGDEYRRLILETIERCDATVVLWSSRSASSDFVMDEAELAKSLGKLCPVRIDDVQLPLGFGQLHTVDLQGWNGDPHHAGFESLTRALQSSEKDQTSAGLWGRQESPAQPSQTAASEPAADSEPQSAARCAGRWVADVRYPWGIQAREHFELDPDPDGTRLHGAASFAGTPRPILDGRIAADRIFFTLRIERMPPPAVEYRYRGTFVGDRIEFVLDNPGHAATRFHATRDRDPAR